MVLKTIMDLMIAALYESNGLKLLAFTKDIAGFRGLK